MKAFFKNLLVYFLLLFRPKKTHPSFEKNPRILIVTTTALGDTLWATPAVRAIKNQYPQAFIGVLTSKTGLELLKHDPSVDELYLLKEPVLFTYFSLKKKLTEKKFSLVLVFHTSQRLTVPLIASIQANKIIGSKTEGKGWDHLFTEKVPIKDEHEIERRLSICEKIGVKTADKTLKYFALKDENEKAKKYLKKIIPLKKGPIIAIHPGAKDFYKCWPKEYFKKLAKNLHERCDCHILITGSKEEHFLMDFIASSSSKSIAIKEPLSLRFFAALINNVDLIITNDTGPMHLACSQNVPTIAVFSPTDPSKCGPYQAASGSVLYKPKTCTPCLKRKCREPFCLRQISVESVLDLAAKKLKIISVR